MIWFYTCCALMGCIVLSIPIAVLLENRNANRPAASSEDEEAGPLEEVEMVEDVEEAEFVEDGDEVIEMAEEL